MKYTFAAAALVAVASAQSLSDIPTCAVPCIDDARTSATSCSKEDYACICKNQEALTAAATTCVLKDCGAEKALNEVLPAVKAFCEKVAAAPAPSSAEPTTKAEPTKAEPTTKAEPEPTTKAESSYEVKPTPEASSSASVVTSMSLTVSVTGSMTTMAPSATYPASHSGPHATSSMTESSPIATAGAAHFGVAGAGVLAALAAFL